MDEGQTQQRRVAGLWCREVLERLPDLLDGALTSEETEQIGAHLAGCQWCERFGGTYGTLVTKLRASAAPAPTGVAERLRSRLAGVLGE